MSSRIISAADAGQTPLNSTEVRSGAGASALAALWKPSRAK
jgi:hypothetical protein